jgi:hypothetical protein
VLRKEHRSSEVDLNLADAMKEYVRYFLFCSRGILVIALSNISRSREMKDGND